jgi:hypothetical protein
MYQFPYVSISWVLDTPLLESEFDFRRYIDGINLNFDKKSILMLESIDQVHNVIEYVQNQQVEIKTKNEGDMAQIVL